MAQTIRVPMSDRKQKTECLQCGKPATRFPVILIWAKGYLKYSHTPAEADFAGEGFCDECTPSEQVLKDIIEGFDEVARGVGRAPAGDYELVWKSEAQTARA